MAERVRFVHAADLHLDAPFKGVDATDARVRDALATCTYDALERVVDTCIEREVDFLVLAGDVYNHAEKSLRAEFAFRAACERLGEAGIHVYVARGNHDPASGFSAGLVLPDTVHFFSERAVERVVHERGGRELCALYGRSFRTGAESANFAREYRRSADDALAIGVLHTNVGGRADYEPYAPCSLDDVLAARMDYWALGHIHKRETLNTDPHVVYSGCTQGLDPSEHGTKGCMVVTLADGGTSTEFVQTASIVWDHVTVSSVAADSVDGLRALVLDALGQASARAEGRPVILRVTLTDRSHAHAALRRPGMLRDFVADVRAEGLEREPWVWVDRIADHTRPELDLAAVRAGEDFAADLLRRTDALLDDEDATNALVQSLATDALGAVDGRDVPALDPRTILERARDLALDALLAEESR